MILSKCYIHPVWESGSTLGTQNVKDMELALAGCGEDSTLTLNLGGTEAYYCTLQMSLSEWAMLKETVDAFIANRLFK